MLERSLVKDEQTALFDVKEYPKKFPDSYLKLDKEKFISDLDISKAPIMERYARCKSCKKWQDEAFGLATGILSLSNLVVQEHPDTIVLLDKSARPVAHFLKCLWRNVYPQCSTPEIRFINIGREWPNYNFDEKLFDDLYHAHFRSMNCKKVMVADEYIQSGETISMAKYVLNKAFPDIKYLLCTGVFTCNNVPFWFREYFNPSLGVYDHSGLMDMLPCRPNTNDQISFTCKTPAGVIARHREINVPLNKEAIQMTQTSVNNLRFELGYLANAVANNCEKYVTDLRPFEPNLCWRIGDINSRI